MTAFGSIPAALTAGPADPRSRARRRVTPAVDIANCCGDAPQRAGVVGRREDKRPDHKRPEDERLEDKHPESNGRRRNVTGAL